MQPAVVYGILGGQDSKLTRLLQDGLGGDAKSMVIICASMDEYDSAETLQALRFGEPCQRVENEATVGQQQVAGMLQKLDARIAELEDVIRDEEYWEVREVKRVDDLVEQGIYEATLAGNAGGEVVRTTVLVDAEAEREELVGLLQRRAALASEVHRFVWTCLHQICRGPPRAQGKEHHIDQCIGRRAASRHEIK